MFKTLKSIILGFTLFLFPLFFLPLTQEFFTTNKLYRLLLADVLLILLSAFESIFHPPSSKPASFPNIQYPISNIFFLFAVLLSTLIISPNKIQALLNPNFGFVMLLSLAIYIYYLSKSSLNILKILSLSTLILAATTVVYYVNPFQNYPLPLELQFLKNRFFTPIGTQMDLAIFLGFMFLAQSIQITLYFSSKLLFNPLKSFKFLYLPLTLLTLAALILCLSYLYTGAAEPMMPFKYSWTSFAETLKNPFNAIFGIGIDNLPAAFTRSKDIGYNHSSLWQVRSFDVSRSTILHIATESGLLGLSTIILILVWAFKKISYYKYPITNIYYLFPLFYITVIIVFFPPSLIVFFIFFLGLVTVTSSSSKFHYAPLNSSKFLYYPLTFFLILLTSASIFLLSQSFLAEYYFKLSVDALAQKNGKTLYDNQRKAILTNPFIERFHINFSQTNLLLFNSLTLKNTQPSNQFNLASDSARIALLEAEIATRLNPQKATNWENMAVIARNLTDVFGDARKKSISAYEKAILLDPQNPQYRFSLGTLHYASADFSEAIRSFEHAVVLKSDWANAHYNLAWANYQKKDFEKAIKELQASISLLDKKKDQLDLEKAQKDLEMMKSSDKLPSNPLNSFNSDAQSQLNLPTDKPATPEPRLDIFKNATLEGQILNSASPESEIKEK